VTKGTKITMPTPSATASGYTFVGWTTSTVSNSTSAPSYYKVGASYTANSNVTFKALYKYTRTTTSGTKYTKVTSAPSDWSGTYLIVYEGEKMVFNGSLTSPDVANNYKTVSISSSSITASSTVNKYAVTIAKTGSGYTIKTASGYYIGRTSDSNGLNASTSTKYTNTISVSSGGSVTIKSGGAYLRFNTTSGQDRFRYFKSSTYSSQKTICLYKLSGSTTGSTTYYITG
ncbi:MAG: InlB B-repeat-containing protein, partial [Oscillospiraceae bacterium]|nr:InlB B-repeat-containing protein [Oscillospiraceae bacterium]